jgi:hypothetical protein
MTEAEKEEAMRQSVLAQCSTHTSFSWSATLHRHFPAWASFASLSRFRDMRQSG